MFFFTRKSIYIRGLRNDKVQLISTTHKFIKPLVIFCQLSHEHVDCPVVQLQFVHLFLEFSCSWTEKKEILFSVGADKMLNYDCVCEGGSVFISSKPAQWFYPPAQAHCSHCLPKPENNWLLTVHLLGQRWTFIEPPSEVIKIQKLPVQCGVTSPGQLWRLAQREPSLFRSLSWSGCIWSSCRGIYCKRHELL